MTPKAPSLILAGLTLSIATSAVGATTGPGIVYTCDPSVTALEPQVCDVLNTTIAGLYSAAFTNANATIYVTMGSITGFDVSQSYFWTNFYSYSQFRSQLAASASSSTDVTALADSVPATSPYGSSLVQIPTALQRALGFPAPKNGVNASHSSCSTLGSNGCYDGLITLNTTFSLYFRTGAIAKGQYDFYTAIEHETDEVLGTGSCAFGCSGRQYPTDFFRYHSDGTRSFAAGTNNSCSSPDSTNACLSIDGVHMLQQYNNLNNGNDAGDWLTNCHAQQVQEADFCVGTTGVDLNLDAEILLLDAVGYAVQPQIAPKGTFPCTNTTPPTITSVDSASAYGAYAYFASGSWLEIKGTNLADPNDPRLTAAVNPGQWTLSDFTGVNAPTVLDGVSVTINGKPAAVWYLSPGQLNVQAPEDSVTGNLAINVTNCLAESPAYPFAHQPLAPGLLAPSNYTANGTQYLVATFASDGAYVLKTSVGASFGLASRPAKPGDMIIAYGVGFGDVTPTIPPGLIAQQGNALVNPVAFSFGQTPATLSYSGLAPNFVGLYEFYIQVPAGLANGDYQIMVTQNGTALPQKMYLTVQN